MSKRMAIKDMSCGSIDVKPVDADWQELAGSEAAEFTEASRCETCDAVLVGGGGQPHRYADDESSCDGHVPEQEGPMMNYWYPLDIDDEGHAARTLVDTCLCVVRVGNQTGLALTGGGMNLSWEICEAFMLLGHLPPLHFADLPGMAGRGTSARDRWIVAGCIKSCAVAASWATDRAKRLRRTVREARAREAKKYAAA